MRIRIAFKNEALENIEKELKKLDILEMRNEEKNENNISRIYDIEPNKYR